MTLLGLRFFREINFKKIIMLLLLFFLVTDYLLLHYFSIFKSADEFYILNLIERYLYSLYIYLYTTIVRYIKTNFQR